ncbi:3'-5' exonuclease [Mesobacillus zeae]|uniref:3'-5' exonuclease n=1 Tax=Mesobacillus zeae TaxID=1917180 RepID=A0A398B659_9BACI|nr:3'-5' exonuclease [Mesobacillus zeae]RID84934.1 3'-5' exonuclease [Mesobacillus zeae]
MHIFNGNVVCPRCDGNGLVYKSRVVDLDLIIYICDECEASWQNEEIILNEFQDLSAFLQDKGLVYEDVRFVDLGYDWKK